MMSLRTLRRPLALVATVLMGALVGGASVSTDFGEPSARAALIAPDRAAKLVSATSGEALVAARATGEQAQLINAAMPFTQHALQSARPFDLSGADATNHRRALLCLSQAIYYEAGYEPIDGRRAVAQVVLNRMRHPAFPKSVCGVVYQGAQQPVCQFSFVCDGSLYRRPALGAWKQAEAVAAAALAGYVERSVGAATHYHADYVAPYWAPMLAKISKLGAHIFYRWPGAWGSTAAFTGRYIGEPADPLSLRPALREAVLIDGTIVAVEPPVETGPQIARAPNDLGGLLDPSKGWTLNIPMPADAASATRTVSAQQGSTASATASAPPPAAVARAEIAAR